MLLRVDEPLPHLRDSPADLRAHHVGKQRGRALVGERDLRAALGEARRAPLALEAQRVALGRGHVLELEVAVELRAHRPEGGRDHDAIGVVARALDRLAAGNRGAQALRVVQRTPCLLAGHRQPAFALEVHGQRGSCVASARSESMLCMGMNASTWGSMEAMPEACGWNPA